MTEHQVERQEREHAEKLKSIMELFPEMSQEVVDTILFNNHGQVDTTINALLSMSDTSYKPDDADIARQEELRRDEAFARRLAENELQSTRQRHADPRRARPTPPPAPPAIRTSSSFSESGTRKPSKIREMFRRKKNTRHSEPPTDGRPDIGQPRRRGERQRMQADEQDRYIRPQHTLDSDFSDSRHSNNSSLSSSDGIAGSPAHRRNHSDSNSNGRRAPAASNANVVDLLSEDANSTLAAYAPLRPLKHVPRSPNASTPISPIAPVTPETPMSPIVPVGPPALEHHGVEPHIDLDNPFDDNPLLHIPGAVSSRPVTATRGELLHGSGNQSPSHLHTNPFGLPSDGAVLPDNNPFRSRRS